MTGCEIIGCPDFVNGRCVSPADFVNAETGVDMCPRNSSAIPKEEYEGQQTLGRKEHREKTV